MKTPNYFLGNDISGLLSKQEDRETWQMWLLASFSSQTADPQMLHSTALGFSFQPYGNKQTGTWILIVFWTVRSRKLNGIKTRTRLSMEPHMFHRTGKPACAHDNKRFESLNFETLHFSLESIYWSQMLKELTELAVITLDIWIYQSI